MRKAFLVATAACLTLPGLAVGQSWRNVTMSRQLDSERDLDVRVRYGAGRFRVSPAGGNLLYRMELRYDEDRFEPKAEYERGRLSLGVESVGRSLRVGRDHSGGELDLSLARNVPMELDLEFGAVRAELDLGGLSLRNLALKTGASESTVDISEPNPLEMGTATFAVGAADFEARRLGNLNAEHIEVDAGVGEVTLALTGNWRRDASVSIDMGLGALELRIPEGLGVRIEKSSFLSSFDSEGLVKRGSAYYSLDWGEAETKVSIDLDAAFGSVRVIWVR